MNESLKAYIEDIKQLLEWAENAEVESEAFRKTLKKCLMSELEKIQVTLMKEFAMKEQESHLIKLRLRF